MLARRQVITLVMVVVLAVGAFVGLRYWREVRNRERSAQLLAQAQTKGTVERLKLLLQALRLTPDDKALHEEFLAAASWVLPEDRPKATEYTVKAAATVRASGRLWAKAAQFLAAEGRKKRGREAAERAIKLGGLDECGHYDVAASLLANKDADRALDHFLEGLKQSEYATQEVLWCTTLAGYYAGRTQVVLDKVKALYEEERWSYYESALLEAQVAAGKDDEARKFAAELMADKGLATPAATAAAYAALRSDDLDEMAQFLRSEQMTISVPQANLMRAIFWCRRGDYERALQAYVRAALWHRMGEVAQIPGNRGPSVGLEPAFPTDRQVWVVLRASAHAGGEDVDALMIVGCARYMLGQDAEARAAFERAAATDAQAEPARTYLETGSLENWVTWEGMKRDGEYTPRPMQDDTSTLAPRR